MKYLYLHVRTERSRRELLKIVDKCRGILYTTMSFQNAKIFLVVVYILSVKICLSGDCFVLFQCTLYVQLHIHIISSVRVSTYRK